VTETAETVWSGPDALRPLLVPLADLEPHPRNPRRGNVTAVAESLTRFGQAKPIVLQTDGRQIVAGHHLALAAEQLGWTHVAALPSIPAEHADAFLIADNRLSDIAGWEDGLLAEILRDLADDDALAGTGWTADEFDDLQAELARLADGADGALAALGEPGGEPGPRMREFVLLLSEEQHRQFEVYVKILAKELETEGPVETVFRAVGLAAQRATAGGAEAV
jgi:hypothetical protein